MVTAGQQNGADESAEVERWRAEALRLADENMALRKQLADEGVAQRERLAELEGQVAALAEKVATYARMLFGDSSEQAKRKNKPTPKPGRGGQKQDGDDPAGQRGQRRGSRGHGRRDYSDLDTEEQVHDLPPEQRTCPVCGTAYQRL